MFADYETYPGWWLSAMLILARTKSTTSKKEYKDFCETFIEYIVAPSYPSGKKKKVWIN